ncbi:tyrosine-type recombinase/integrase [Actinomadura sp. SCN-SB]|uniref:tyrosine-type recombinase/integrase n=1 Tax=Actinomadura sp. SCN-SB TaxID=3373092 RepID=UPI0037531064
MSYDVRIWGIRKRSSKQGNRYQVRWTVAGEVKFATFVKVGLAKSHRAKLLTAANEGEAFDVVTGLPLSMLPREEEPEQQGPSWYEFALAYADMKWPAASAASRRGIAEALATASLALVPWEGRHPDRQDLYRALSTWAFNVTARAAGLPAELEPTIRWVEKHSMPLVALADGDVLRSVLDQLARCLDGSAAAASTYRRKRATLFNALSYAVEKQHIEVNPLLTMSRTAPKNTETIDRRRVVNEATGLRLVIAVGRQGATGRHLKAFFGCLFLAGLRPGEATALTEDELALPENDNEWGWFDLGDSSPQTGGEWTDSGKREVRPLKHRSAKETRPVPIPPPLVKLIRRHLLEFGTAPDGRLFRAAKGGLLSESVYTRVWGEARSDVLTPAEVQSVLAERPYDLRHARLSIWLNAGIAPPQVADWAGNSVPVLLRVYAKCLTDSTETALRKLGHPGVRDAQADDVDLPDVAEDERPVEEVTWYELAIAYLDDKWEAVKPDTRKGITEVLTKVTMVTLSRPGPWPTDVQLGRALTSWAFSRDRWAQIPPEQAEVIAWVEEHSPDVGALADPDRLRSVLAYLARRLDGRPASRAVAARRRSTLFNVFEFAVRERMLLSNPLLFRSWDGDGSSRPPLGHKQP